MFVITNEKEVQTVGCVLPNTLVHGDCLEVMKYIPDGSIDLVLTRFNSMRLLIINYGGEYE